MFSTIDAAQPAFRNAESRANLGQYTHLIHTPAILVRDWRREEPDTFTVTARWPEHRGPGPYDPRLLAQTIRQSGLLVAHAEYGVPTGHQTLLSNLNITADPGFQAREASDFEVDIAVTRSTRRSAGLGMEFRIRRDGATVCLADTEFGWVSPAAYRRVRGRHLAVEWSEWPVPEPISRHLVCRADDSDVLLAAGTAGHQWQLRNDVSNTLLFDHPVDHVPGLVLLEAAHQAAHAAAGPTPLEFTDMAISFGRYVEFDEPCWIEARRLPALLPNWCAIVVTGCQGGEVAFQARLRGLQP
ncbi:ScbA/BarX family gamma-butyrolactone biosynthesis protein [Streptomyces beihaiensis]|uniref:ScbA/BarX family gamma-butyrolactone biosynthesis protein n=1 Tax=Streptomyces beihaiensis TaxID=2984495 RepID=A0ABT3TY20_9ACTN|nr:ScbA/BarX family gamma-butyrolactone biosynthesis protein [Streptomyces beihaiensis]MCX3061925.1 ScbA/BarX family gamma-butyrolactone biosynthesis protein [Streptomyces beihaiensis]